MPRQVLTAGRQSTGPQYHRRCAVGSESAINASTALNRKLQSRASGRIRNPSMNDAEARGGGHGMHRRAKELETCSVLLVDDFEDGRQMYREYLTYRGFHIVTARNGEETLAQALLHRPDVISLDLRMPRDVGHRSHACSPGRSLVVDTPIVALTAHALDGERRLALDAGFDELIARPCLPDALPNPRSTCQAADTYCRVGSFSDMFTGTSLGLLRGRSTVKTHPLPTLRA